MKLSFYTHMEAEDREFNQNIYFMLSEIKEQLSLKTNSEVIDFDIKERDSTLGSKKQIRILKFLEEKNVLIAKPYYGKGLLATQMELNALMTGGEPIGYSIHIKESKFNELHKEYLTYKPTKKEKTKYSFELKFIGDRADFSMSENKIIKFGNLVKPVIIETLYNSKGKEVKSSEIRRTIEKRLREGNVPKELNKTIKQMKDQITNTFGIDAEIVIPEGVSGSGYKIGDVHILIIKT